MIHSQLLKADRPYQIISAAGQVGVQVGTLIIMEEKSDEDGYWVDTHSHPVVNYAIKDDLTEDLKYWDGNPEDEWKYTNRLRPEGAVWNKVEIRDIRVLGLVGANNPSLGLDKFVSLVPSISSKYPSNTPLWGPTTDIRIRNLRWALERVNIKCDTKTQNISGHKNREGFVDIKLTIDKCFDYEAVVIIKLRENDYSYPALPLDEIAFRCCLGKDPREFIVTVVNCMTELDNQFIHEGSRIRFEYRQTSETKNRWEELLGQATKQINKAWKSVDVIHI